MRGILNTGNARGADRAWGDAGAARGFHARHFIFDEHPRSKKPGQENVVLTLDQLVEAEPFLERANATLGRQVPPLSTFSGKLLRRNWWQQQDANSIYVVTYLADGLIGGGSAWATQMFVDRHDPGPLPIYAFDQASGLWHTWAGARFEAIDGKPPVPEGVAAAIGTRDMDDRGANAIVDLLS